MMKNKKNWLTIAVILLLAGCNNFAKSGTPSFTIIPVECELKPNEKIALSLQGTQPPGAIDIQWHAPAGSLIVLEGGVLAEFTAPAEPGDVEIVVTTTYKNEVSQTKRMCHIINPDPPPPVPTPAEATTAGEQPALSPTPQPTPTGHMGQIIISEVMINVCGGDDFKRYNQYIELYNNGDVPVDIRGLWIYSPNAEYRGQALIPWAERNPGLTFGKGLIFNSSTIPPHGVALILPPQYMNAPRPFNMPYDIKPGTIILTVDEDVRLGDRFYAMRATPPDLDVVILYEGGRTKMTGGPISTYGTPRISSRYLKYVYDNGADGLPLAAPECSSVERIDPNASDNIYNWTYITPSPGEYIP